MVGWSRGGLDYEVMTISRGSMTFTPRVEGAIERGGDEPLAQEGREPGRLLFVVRSHSSLVQCLYKGASRARCTVAGTWASGASRSVRALLRPRRATVRPCQPW